MKPKNLKSPFSWANRTVVYQDRVWFIPDYYQNYDSFTFPGWEHPDFFGNDQPVHLEYCSGNGSWIAAKAMAHPELNWVAVEKRFDRVRKIWSKIQNHKIDNLIIICGEAYTATHHYFQDASIARIYINFPDPWPKDRHAKHRLIAPKFVQEMGRILIPTGEATFVTDDARYSEEAIPIFSNGPFESQYPSPFFSTEYQGYGDSFFEQLWREKGRTIRYHRFDKKVSV